ncbi:ATP-binding protein [Pseudomonas syringae pv. actinidifoliorum]|nr:ATP-binding protein [Pseudomonas syringae pv. actinidifoliorum]MDU8522544.1 ATP-binding protein [Pseudomonas syringae pv. actinidifoliorum]MDU8529204.1 ATP-binding protein [Pseudomonas syringae pv. actinidifoliorum]
MDGFKKRLSESVQLRLSVSLSLVILAVAIIAGIFAFVSALDEAHEMQDETLRQVAVLFDRQQMTLQYSKNAAIEGDDEESRVIIQYLADGARAAHDDDTSTPLAVPTTLPDGFSTLDVGGEPFRILVRTTSRGERIAVAQETGTRDRDARESAQRSLLPFLILFPVLLIVVGDLVRKLFRPIALLSGEIDQRADQALHPLDESRVPTEIRPFVVAINRLLDRVRQSVDLQNRFVADAAHELRSPLTALSLQAERLALAQMSANAHERLQPLRRGIERGRQLIDQMLALARVQSDSSPPQQPVSVHHIYRRVLEDLLVHAEARQIDIGVEGHHDVSVLMHELDLYTLVRNLVDNAIRYTPYGGRIDLLVGIERDKACLLIKDTGPGIATEERQRVFDPFHRGLHSEQPGSGLGLSIVKAIVERADATISFAFTDETAETGLCVAVWLPRQRQQ